MAYDCGIVPTRRACEHVRAFALHSPVCTRLRSFASGGPVLVVRVSHGVGIVHLHLIADRLVLRGDLELALERSLALDAGRSFAEDALARLTLAHEALSDRGGCARARALYLERYPDGVHAQSVAKRCTP